MGVCHVVSGVNVMFRGVFASKKLRIRDTLVFSRKISDRVTGRFDPFCGPLTDQLLDLLV